MTNKLLAAAGVLLLTAGVPALADPSSGTSQEPTAKSQDEGQNRVICRRIEAIGTRLSSKRVCRTKAEWDAEAAANRQDLERSQTQRWKND